MVGKREGQFEGERLRSSGSGENKRGGGGKHVEALNAPT